MPYEVFTRKVPRFVSPAASISPAGRIYFNRVSADLLRREGAEFVLLLWDREKHRTAIRPLTKKDSRAFSVQYGDHSGAGVSCKSFLGWIGFNSAKKINVTAVWNDDESVLELEIPAEHVTKQKQPQLVFDARQKRAGK